MEQMEAQPIWEIAETVPPEWYEGNLEVLETLVEQLMERRTRVKDLITEFRESSRAPFPNWNAKGTSLGRGQFSPTAWDDSVSGRVM
jgi:hypothetical protein